MAEAMKDKLIRKSGALAKRILGPAPPRQAIAKRCWRKARRTLYHCRQRSRNRKLLLEVRGREGEKIPITDPRGPLVSVRIATYNRARLLTERAIPSVLRQTYKNFEVVIVGDCCTDDTEERIRALNDSRIRFYNMPEHGKSPTEPYDRWMVAGVIAGNTGVDLCQGEWIAFLDDDDEFSADHIEVLLDQAQRYNYEMVYGIVEMEIAPGEWVQVGCYPPQQGKICNISALYHSKLDFLRKDVNAWKNNEPADWNLWRRMKEAGVRIGFVDKVVGKHYLEGTRRGD